MTEAYYQVFERIIYLNNTLNWDLAPMAHHGDVIKNLSHEKQVIVVPLFDPLPHFL